MKAKASRARALCGLLCLLALAACATVPRPRLNAYRELAAWLESHALPSESVGVQQRDVWTRLTGQPLVTLPANGDTFALLKSLQEDRPDYCVASRSVAWEGVQASPWFQEHYRQVTSVAAVDHPGSPLTLYRTRLSPYESGETILLEQTLYDEVAGSMIVPSVSLSSHRLAPGEPVYVNLTLAGNLSEPLTAIWRLRESASGHLWAQDVRLQPGGAPTDAWPLDAPMSERYVVVPPAELPAGEYELELAFLRPNRAPFGDPLLVATLFSPPDVSRVPPEPDFPLEIAVEDALALVGYDAPQRLAPGVPLRIALYWHAERHVERNLKVFVHLFERTEPMSAQSLVAQSDVIPVNWTFPTTEWQPGDYIRDVHLIPLDQELPRGDYRLVVGMYDELTGERLPLRDRDGTSIPDNAAPLYVLLVR